MKTKLLTAGFICLFMFSIFYSAFGRWPTIDRYAEKYPSVSPYSYALGNPISNIDINGDSIDVAHIRDYDATNGTSMLNTLIRDLNAHTGLTFSVTASGMLVYAVDGSGNALISQDGKGNLIGSATARTHMMNGVGHQDIVTVSVAAGATSHVMNGHNTITLDSREINGMISGAVGVDGNTLGWGMTFMHELYHTNVGGGLPDSPYNPGPVVNNMNLIRSELNSQGANFGQRASYHYTIIGGTGYLPFSPVTNLSLNMGRVPLPSSAGSLIQHSYIRIR